MRTWWVLRERAVEEMHFVAHELCGEGRKKRIALLFCEGETSAFGPRGRSREQGVVGSLGAS